MGEIDEYLDNSFKTKQEVPVLPMKYEKNRKSKIEQAGEHVMKHITELAQTTNCTYKEICEKINTTYNLNITQSNLVHFFRSNVELMEQMAGEKKLLNKIRAELHLEHNGILVKDIKKLDQAIEKVEEDDFMESKEKYRLIMDLIDRKGKLLERHHKLNGGVVPNQGSVENMQVNIFGDSKAKSEIIDKLRKVKFNEEETALKTIDISKNA